MKKRLYRDCNRTTRQVKCLDTPLPYSKEKAVNAMVFLAAGIELRLKRIVAYHLLHEFLLELLFAFEMKTGCYCDGFVFDLGPHNLGVLNQFSLFMKKGSNVNFEAHPSDTLRQLMMIPDPVHAAKNFASAFRRSSIKITDVFVKKYNLSSSVASFADVKKVSSMQGKMTFKPGQNYKTKSSIQITSKPCTRKQLPSFLIETSVQQSISQ